MEQPIQARNKGRLLHMEVCPDGHTETWRVLSSTLCTSVHHFASIVQRYAQDPFQRHGYIPLHKVGEFLRS